MFLFVRPPRPLWPFNGPGSAFWPPLAFASMAAALREALPDLPIAILDSPAERKGWRSFEAELRRLRPAYVGIGEEAVSCAEGLRAARIAKESGAIVVAGGCSFSNVASQVLSTRMVDIVVHGEGERTVVETLQALRDGGLQALRGVPGISFRGGDQVVFTGQRELLDDLDTLPMPAFDLLPMHRYGSDSRNHPALVALESSRGCPHQCSFCVLWRQMGRFRAEEPVPCLRAKSPERLLEEVRWVSSRFGRRYVGWVDPCFNANPTVPRDMSELLLRNDLRIGQSAWVRADYLRRDAASGTVDTCVRAGLNELYIGLERRNDHDLKNLKKNCVVSDAEIALRYIAARHPSVSTVGSFIYGIPGETAKSLRELIRDAYTLPLDVAFFIPLTPLPGTPFWNSELWDDEGQASSRYSFLPGSQPENSNMDAALVNALLTYWPPTRTRAYWNCIFAKDSRRRSVVRRHLLRSALFLLRSASRGNFSPGMHVPSWYET